MDIRIYGIDISAQAIDCCNALFAKHNLKGNFAVADFSHIPFAGPFDAVMESGALVYISHEECENVINDIHSKLRPGGKFFFTPYSDRHSWALSLPTADGERRILKTAPIDYYGLGDGIDMSFYSASDIQDKLPPEKWKLCSMELEQTTDLLDPRNFISSAWRVVAQRL